MVTHVTGTPGYNDGWFNGNPVQMIEAGTYDKFRDRMKGLKYSNEQIASLDAANAASHKNKPVAKVSKKSK